MQLPLEGHPLHTRALTVMASTRDDGRWRVRGDVIDLRKCSFVPMMTDLQPAGIIHQMVIDTVVDPDARRLESLEVEQPHVAVEASARTYGECCRDPAPRLQELVGRHFDGTFSKHLSREFAGPLGCSHLLTLFQLMATAIPRALEVEESLQRDRPAAREPGERLFRRGVFIDGHEMSDESIGLGVQLSDFHTRPVIAVDHPLGWLAREDDARIHLRIETPSQRIHDPKAAERTRTAETLSDAVWEDRSDLIRELSHKPVMPGLAARLFHLLGEDPARRRLLDAALQLAPGHIQVMAAITERFFVQKRPEGGDKPSGGEAIRGANVTSLGGLADSCYMWRRDGPMMQARQQVVARASSPREKD